MEVIKVLVVRSVKTILFEDADAWAIADGYLRIIKGGEDHGIAIAAFAPGEWAYVMVTEKEDE